MELTPSAFKSTLSQRPIAGLILIGLLVAPVPCWIAFAHAAGPAEAAATPIMPPPPSSTPASSLSDVRRSLRDFDRFLDHHPLLEDRLRLLPQLTIDMTFLETHPELRDFLRVNPNVTEGLKAYPRYYLNRALLRQASAPVSFHDLGALKDLFQLQPKLEQELNENPELIRDPGFLETHAVLRDFLIQHPALARVFLPPSIQSESK